MRGVLLCLLLGAVTTVAVAWGVALRGGAILNHDGAGIFLNAYDPLTDRMWSMYEKTRLGVHQLMISQFVNGDWIAPAETARIPRPPIDLGEGRLVSEPHDETRFGLPWRAMWCESPWIRERGKFFSVHAEDWSKPRLLLRMRWQDIGEWLGVIGHTGAPDPDESAPTVRGFEEAGNGVPLGVLPIGFTLNTLFWGAVWAMPLFVFPALLRRGRRRRGECARCRYSRVGLAENAACPECGHTP